MPKIAKFILFFLLCVKLLAQQERPPIDYDFLGNKTTKNFINTMVNQYGFDRDYLTGILKNAKLDRDTLAKYQGRFKEGSTVGTWERFKAHVLDSNTLAKAKKFNQKYHTILHQAAREYSVDSEYIVGFLTVESKLGENSGNYRLLDSLATLALHQNRMQKFFYKEFIEFFLMCQEHHFDPLKVQGSFAGAMGCVQQMPSVFRKYGMDYNGNGIKNPWEIEDCIGIIARFMHTKGWTKGKDVAVAATFENPENKQRFTKLKTGFKTLYTLEQLQKYGVTPVRKVLEYKVSLIKLNNKNYDELWLGMKNFRVLAKYNPSSNYAMAIHKIAEHIK